MTDQQTHPYTGIPLSKTFLKSMANARVDIEELPDTVDDCDGEISEAQAQIELMDQQVALEAAGATRRSAKDPKWPLKVASARVFFARRRGVLVRWRKRLQAMETALNPPDPIPAQMRKDYQRALARQILHYKKVNAEMNACKRGLKAVVARLDEASRNEVYAEIDAALAALPQTLPAGVISMSREDVALEYPDAGENSA